MPKLPDGKRYECDVCHGVFDLVATEEEARAEAERLWGESPDTHDMGIVCDDCFHEHGFCNGKSGVESKPAFEIVDVSFPPVISAEEWDEMWNDVMKQLRESV